MARKPTITLVGTAEAAELLGVERPRIARWQSKGWMPDPLARLACGPVWDARDITKFGKDREKARAAA